MMRALVWATQTEVYPPVLRRRLGIGPEVLSRLLHALSSHHQMPTAKPTAPRKRNRKRKRRLASSSSSSDSDSSSDEAEVSKKTPVKKATPIKPHATASPAEESSPSSSSSSPSSSDSEEGDDAPHAPVTHPAPSSAIPQRSDSEPAKTRERPRSPSPSPPPADAPPFLPPEGSSSRAQDEQALRNRFRQFWMASVADAFADDLEQIRQVRISTIRVFPPPVAHAGVT
jgi:DNA mismatch repair ATPase MutL